MNGYQYVALRCVPRVDREEFVNVGVVLYCQQADFLEARCHVDADRLAALAPDLVSGPRYSPASCLAAWAHIS
mgnify:CR=1 FL=1